MADLCTLSAREARRCFDKLAASEIAADSAEAIHDLRVGCRRARVALAEFKPNFRPATQRSMRNILEDAGRKLSAARELDVSLGLILNGVGHGFDGSPALEFIRRRLHEARANEELRLSGHRLNKADFHTLMGRIMSDFTPSDECHLRYARKRLSKRLKRLRKQYDVWRKSGLDDDLHVLRIRFKNMRYTVEIYEHLYGKHAKSFLDELESGQESLGQWNDRRILRDKIAEAASGAPQSIRKDLVKLGEVIGEGTDELQRAIKDETKKFFRKGAVREYESLFTDPKRACCGGAR